MKSSWSNVQLCPAEGSGVPHRLLRNGKNVNMEKLKDFCTTKSLLCRDYSTASTNTEGLLLKCVELTGVTILYSIKAWTILLLHLTWWAIFFSTSKVDPKEAFGFSVFKQIIVVSMRVAAPPPLSQAACMVVLQHSQWDHKKHSRELVKTAAVKEINKNDFDAVRKTWGQKDRGNLFFFF